MYTTDTTCQSCNRQVDIAYHGECLDCLTARDEGELDNALCLGSTEAKSGVLGLLMLMRDLVTAQLIHEAHTVNAVLRRAHVFLDQREQMMVAGIAADIWDAAEARRRPYIHIPPFWDSLD